MTPKEKADEIYHSMYSVSDMMGNYPMCFDTAKECSLIAVNQILKQLQSRNYGMTNTHNTDIKYWEQVKKEINSL